MPVYHATSFSGEFTICGIGFDAEEFGPVHFASTGARVTCPHCLEVINYCKSFKNNRQP